MITVVLPTHDPEMSRLSRTLEGLANQVLSADAWELVVVDNASANAIRLPDKFTSSVRAQVVTEPKLGLTYARRTGVEHARGDLIVLVDDDNVLAPNYLETVGSAFKRLPSVGALGGKSIPEFESPPDPWVMEFLPLLAVRDLGEIEQISPDPRQMDAKNYPSFAPIGAGMALRRTALATWLAQDPSFFPDRSGRVLSSAGDNQIVFSVLEGGWRVAYVPQLILTHLIPTTRLDPDYLGRLNRGIQCSWTKVLLANGVESWPAIPSWTVPLRKAKSFITYRAWRDRSSKIRWQGVCGHFEGRAN